LQRFRAVNQLVAFLRLGRLQFLGGGFLLYALGAAIAGVVDGSRYVLGQLAVVAFQLMTHYANDYFDYDADRANLTPTRWSGGSRVLVAGELPREVALHAALGLASIGIALTAITGSGILVAIGVLAWVYSAPPLRLCARGLGELDTAVVVTGLVPWLAFDLQGGADTRLLVLAIVPLALLQAAMLLAIELPDRAGDAATGKRTLVVRLGAERGAELYGAITIAAFASLPLAAIAGMPWRVALAGLVPVPVALWRLANLDDHRDATKREAFAATAVGLLVATELALLAAVVTNSTTAASS
jgi:1,4-dihydroxy-2-naphthoate octaprenyltransferase